jgi:hypothetical protein
MRMLQAGRAPSAQAWETRRKPVAPGRLEAEGMHLMADPDRAVEVRGTVTVHPAGAPKNPDALVAEIERTRENLAQTIDILMERVSPANNARMLRERLREEAARPEVRLAAAAVGLTVAGIVILRIWGRRRR